MSRASLVVLSAALALPASASAQRYSPILMLDSTFASSTRSLATNVRDADVEVSAGSVEQIRVRIYSTAPTRSEARDFFDRQRFSVSRRGDGVSVADDPEPVHFWNRRRGPDLKIEITVPRNIDLDIATSDGDIAIGDVTGHIAVRSSDGDLSLGRLAGAGITLETSDGDVEAESLDAPSIDVRTSDGDVTLRAVSGALRARSSDGDVDLTLLKPGDTEIETRDGDVSVTIPDGAGFDVDLSGGEVDLHDLQLQVSGRVGEDHVSGRLGAGGPRLTVRSGDGDVTLRRR